MYTYVNFMSTISFIRARRKKRVCEEPGRKGSDHLVLYTVLVGLNSGFEWL